MDIAVAPRKAQPPWWPSEALPRNAAQAAQWVDASIAKTRAEGLASGYVRVGDLGTPYHLAMTAAGPMVMRLSWREQGGHLVPEHDLFGVQVHEHALAVQAWAHQCSEARQAQLNETPRRSVQGMDAVVEAAPSPLGSVAPSPMASRRTRRGA